MMKITKVIPNADYLLTVYFDNRDAVIIDMKKKLQTIRFSELSNAVLFNSVKTDGRALLWAGEISISISEILGFIEQ